MEVKDIEKTRGQMKRGVLEMCILAITAEDEVYTTDIINKLKETKLAVVEGTLYPMLSRLRKGGMLDYTWKESESGPPRKYYFITEKGTVALKELVTAWKDISTVVNETVDGILTDI